MNKRINEGLAKICEMLATYENQTEKQKLKLMKYAKVFRALGDLNKKTKSQEEKNMGKKLTEQEKDDREVKRILAKIHKLKKIHPQELVEKACYRYKMANVDKRKAEKSIAELEENLADAKKRLK